MEDKKYNAADAGAHAPEPAAAGRQTLLQRFCRETWSPWVCGALLGLCSIACLALAGHRLGAIGGFETLASMLATALGVADMSTYFSVFRLPQFDERGLIYLGIIIGAAIGAASSGTLRARALPSKQWKQRFGGSVAKRWVVMFLGCVLVALGAGIAGGCTSGLGVSGMMQLAPAGFVFFAAAFAVGVPIALVLYRKKGGRK